MLVHELLGSFWLREGDKAVVSTNVTQLIGIHCFRQPLATIYVDLNSKRKPGLNARMHESKLWVKIVMI